MRIVRILAGNDGESHFDEAAIELSLIDFAPPAQPLYKSDSRAATSYSILELPAGWGGDAHVTPRRQVLFLLSGAIRVTTSDGDSRLIEPGTGLELLDTTGLGHRSEVVSNERAVGVMVALE